MLRLQLFFYFSLPLFQKKQITFSTINYNETITFLITKKFYSSCFHLQILVINTVKVITLRMNTHNISQKTWLGNCILR